MEFNSRLLSSVSLAPVEVGEDDKGRGGGDEEDLASDFRLSSDGSFSLLWGGWGWGGVGYVGMG